MARRHETPQNRAKLIGNQITTAANHLTNRWSRPLAAVKSTSDFMKPFLVFATSTAASGGSTPVTLS
jgi:hypothetical protein